MVPLVGLSMKLRYVDMRVAIPSGGSAKVTIPIVIVEEHWRKVRYDVPHDKKAGKCIDSFPICFIQEDGKVLIEPPENILKSEDYSEELKSQINTDWLKHQRKVIAKEWDEIYVSFAKGQITENDLEERLHTLRKRIKEMAIHYRSAFSERELHFMSADDIGQLVAAISIEDEHEKEERFLSLIEDVTDFNSQLYNIKNTLRQLEQGFSEGRVSKNYYEILRERYLGKQTLVEERLRRLKKIVCSS